DGGAGLSGLVEEVVAEAVEQEHRDASDAVELALAQYHPAGAGGDAQGGERRGHDVGEGAGVVGGSELLQMRARTHGLRLAGRVPSAPQAGPVHGSAAGRRRGPAVSYRVNASPTRPPRARAMAACPSPTRSEARRNGVRGFPTQGSGMSRPDR